jgi:hypothetical protein
VSDVTEKVERAIARFDRVARQLDDRRSPARDAASRERARLNEGLGRTAAKVAIAVACVWVATIAIGLLRPIGIFGFVAALAMTALVTLFFIARGGKEVVAPAAPSADLPNGPMVDRFDSYIFRVRRALPPPAQGQLDAISAILPALKQTLERVETLDPTAQDARRLMSIHLPGLVERYLNVPEAFRAEKDGEGRTVDEQLVQSLAAARTALGEISEQLARSDMAAFETQGRFIKSRYGEQGIESEDASNT